MEKLSMNSRMAFTKTARAVLDYYWLTIDCKSNIYDREDVSFCAWAKGITAPQEVKERKKNLAIACRAMRHFWYDLKCLGYTVIELQEWHRDFELRIHNDSAYFWDIRHEAGKLGITFEWDEH